MRLPLPLMGRDGSAASPLAPTRRRLNDRRPFPRRCGRMRQSLRLPLLLALVLSHGWTSAQAQETLWPAPRSSHGMTWHDRLGQVVVLGGVEQTARTRWMWGWDGTNWAVLDTTGPGDRGHFGFAYDSARDRLVLHGGLTAGPDRAVEPARHGDTWEWDGRAWSRRPEGGPGARDHTAMAFDPVRRVVVLFGGGRPDGALLGDTWTWDGTAWVEASRNGPPARATHRLVWDDARQVVFLFGGWGASGLLADTWTWDGTRWTELEPGPGPAPRFASRMAYDARGGDVVLYGGRGDERDFADTWIWDGARWTRRETEGPGPLNVHEMAYDPRRERVVLFGGFHAGEMYADLWEWDGSGWEQMLPD